MTAFDMLLKKAGIVDLKEMKHYSNQTKGELINTIYTLSYRIDGPDHACQLFDFRCNNGCKPGRGNQEDENPEQNDKDVDYIPTPKI